MADLRIVDAPEIPTENITGAEKLPTGGSGNYSISLDSVADYTKTKKDLADNATVDTEVNGVRQELNAHIEDSTNPHQVTKGQIGLGNVDNTADADKPVSNSTQAAIISAVAPKADKTYVDNSLSNLSTVASKFCPTLVAANSDIANISVNQVVNIGEVANGGLWYKATTGATSLTKSPYDPLTQAKKYTDVKNADKLSGIKSKNLVNPNDYVVGYQVNHSNGQLLASSNYTATGYIPVEGGAVYTFSHRYPLAFYDENKVFITGSNNTEKTLTAPTGAAFVRTCMHFSVVGTFQMEIGSEATAYEPYHDIYLKNTAIPDGFVSPRMIATKSITPEKTNFLQASKNLFNKSTATQNFLIATNGNLVENVTYSTSDFIEVKPSTTYIGVGSNGTRSYCFFDKNKVAIGGSQTATSESFTSPANAKFIRVSLWTSNLDTYQFEQSATKTSYAQYGYALALADGTPILTSASIESKWKDKKWATLGDSITQGATWQGFVNAVHKLNWTNYGVGGSKISGASGDTTAMCQDTRINAIPTDVDLITLMGGTNDWSQSVALGTIDSTDPTTFYGALNTFVTKAYDRWNAKRICIATTPYGDRPDWATPTKNSLGLTINDYAEAIRLICKKYNIYCIDVNALAGGNSLNITTWIGGSTTDHFHPSANSPAAKGIGTAYISALNQIAPVA